MYASTAAIQPTFTSGEFTSPRECTQTASAVFALKTRSAIPPRRALKTISRHVRLKALSFTTATRV